MNGLIAGFEGIALDLLWIGVGLAVAMTLAIVIERVALAVDERRLSRAERDYGPLIARALRNDGEAGRALVESPSGDRLAIARLLIIPLIEDRDPERLAATRALLQRMDAAADPEEKAKLERALYHGLDAFQLREVIPVHEDLEP